MTLTVRLLKVHLDDFKQSIDLHCLLNFKLLRIIVLLFYSLCFSTMADICENTDSEHYDNRLQEIKIMVGK